MNIQIEVKDDFIIGKFTAMASPCEVLIDSQDTELARLLVQLAQQEAARIEAKYSRYQPTSVLSRLNQSNGAAIEIDAETFRLLEFADTCYALSQQRFDITSGVLRKAWRFDGSSHLPTPAQVNALLPYIGWQRVEYNEQVIRLPQGFELDLGGIGKEYAVDNVAAICAAHAPDTSVLVNFGGDIQVTQPRRNQQHWVVGIENPTPQNDQQRAVKILGGGLATSGDARRFLLKDGKRYGHVLNPMTGYPIEGAPRSVTVAAAHCTQAGLLATLALLQGSSAESFLQQQNCQYWCYW